MELQTPRQLKLLLFLAALPSCASKPATIIWRGIATLDSTALVITLPSATRVDGPTLEICMASEVKELTTKGDSMLVPGLGGVHISIDLINSSGIAERLGVHRDTIVNPNNPKGTVTRRENGPGVLYYPETGLVCFWDQYPRSSDYSRLTLRSDKPFRITSVSWWTGTRKAFI